MESLFNNWENLMSWWNPWKPYNLVPPLQSEPHLNHSNMLFQANLKDSPQGANFTISSVALMPEDLPYVWPESPSWIFSLFSCILSWAEREYNRHRPFKCYLLRIWATVNLFVLELLWPYSAFQWNDRGWPPNGMCSFRSKMTGR